ncbi:hypothetical protein [Vreelandella alkaliphila]|uniref:Spy/CpxP family protein refolding chaperone n=1 Tax=Vreelandella alkaliphila TaxID=272774 RepID=A0A7C9NPQ0_9GAMM|nr:hypothetical protein [Halomonas alkaliphila]NDL68972.1 hypothetical protein [Halomonas alkaliphila]
MLISKKLLTAIFIAPLGVSAATAQTVSESRDVSELSSPIVLLTPVVARNADHLQLDIDQRSALQDWMAKSPAVREALEDLVVAQRNELRQMILSGADIEARTEKAAYIGQLESELLMMRSSCVEYWRETLNEEQFAQALQLADI